MTVRLGGARNLRSVFRMGAREIAAYARSSENRRHVGWISSFFLLILVYTPLRSSTDLKNGYLRPTREILYAGDNSWFGESSINSYSPFFYSVMAFFAQFTDTVATVLWCLLNITLYFGINILIIAIIDRARPGSAKLSYFVAPILTLVLLADNLYLGQSNIFAFFFTLCALFSYQRRNDFAAGVLLSIAVAYKLAPALFALHFLLKRRVRTLYGLVVGLILCLLVVPSLYMGPVRNLQNVQTWIGVSVVPFVAGQGVETQTVSWSATNQSLEAALNRHLTPFGQERYGGLHVAMDPAFLEEPQVAKLAAWARVFLVLALVVLILRRGPGGMAFPFEVGLLFISMLLISPVAWISHFILLLMPYAVAVNQIVTLPVGAPGRTLLVSAVAGSTLLMAPSVAPGLQSYSFVFLGTLFLFCGMLFYAFRHLPAYDFHAQTTRVADLPFGG